MAHIEEHIKVGGQQSKGERRLSMLFYLLTAYILLQFSWWAYLLIDLNTKYYSTGGSETVRIKVLMIAGEGSVFLIFLLTGIYIMQRTIRKDISLVKQQRNFLLSITHELKTPLAAIKLCLQTMEKRQDLQADQRLPLQRSAIENTERLHNLIDNVLLATRIESGQEVIQKERINLSDDTNRICNGILKAISGSVQLECEVEDGLESNLDSSAYESILVNLVENAVKYAGNEAVRVSLRHDGKHIILSVADQGPGIPSGQKERIFEKFYRMGNEETRTRKGTGLGLYIVKQLADLHGALVSVTNNHPKGTIFTVRFPL